MFNVNLLKNANVISKIAGLEHILPNKMIPALFKGLADKEEYNVYECAKALGGYISIMHEFVRHHVDFGDFPQDIEDCEDFHAFFSEATTKVQTASLVLVKKGARKKKHLIFQNPLMAKP